jgi:hypothetical protein
MHERGALETRGLAAQFISPEQGCPLKPASACQVQSTKADPIRFLRFENYVDGGSTDSLSGDTRVVRHFFL